MVFFPALRRERALRSIGATPKELCPTYAVRALNTNEVATVTCQNTVTSPQLMASKKGDKVKRETVSLQYSSPECQTNDARPWLFGSSMIKTMKSSTDDNWIESLKKGKEQRPRLDLPPWA